MSLAIASFLDGAGDAWLELTLHAPSTDTLELSGIALPELLSCHTMHNNDTAGCEPVPVLGAADGKAARSEWLVAANHAFGDGVRSACMHADRTDCVVRMPAGAAPALLTRLSVVLPHISPNAVVCAPRGVSLYSAGGGSRSSAVKCSPPLKLLDSPRMPFGRGVAFVKTYKTGSSTMASLLYRHAENHALTPAVNAKAVPYHEKLLSRLNNRDKRARPTDCLYEMHTFKACGETWMRDQRTGGIRAPRPFGLIADHSRLERIMEASTRSGATSLPHECTAFLVRMREGETSGVHAMLTSVAARESLSACVEGMQRSRHNTSIAAIAAYRESVPGGLLMTAVRWPASRFLSAVEQFKLPQRTNVPCERIYGRGGACHGHTCSHDFNFHWRCLNVSTTRTGMLSTFLRCYFEHRETREKSLLRLSDIERFAASSATSDARTALNELRVELKRRLKGAAVSDARRCGPAGVLRSKAFGGEMRFIQESVPVTLGFPLALRERSDSFGRMLSDSRFAGVALRWLAEIARSFDLVVITEYFDESLLLLGHEMGWPMHELVYISQKRRRTANLVRHREPAARALLDPRALPSAAECPSAAALRMPDGPWLWPHELDVALRANWLDTLAYVHFNQTLWTRIRSTWPGQRGQAEFARRLTRFRQLRETLRDSCRRCEELGPERCRSAHGEGPHEASPHLCWQMDQDTKSWSEHFFVRMAARIDGAVAGADVAKGKSAARRGVEAGVTTGNVRWWRCAEGTGRVVHPRCRTPRRADYSAWNCLCGWPR